MSIRIATIAAAAALAFATPAFATGKETKRSADFGYGGGDYASFADNYSKSGRFERMDSDKDGVISRDEMMKADFARYDRDRDGSLNEEESGWLNKEYEEETIGGNPDAQ